MTTFEIKKAERKGSKVFVQLAGLSDSGKTYSAIQLARGLVGEKGKIGFIDTEQRRASHYADVAGGFDVIDMTAPFSPENYIKATKTFKDAGFDCLIIDSMSHEWDGIGGVLNMAEEQKSSKGYALKGQAKWLKPKLEHKKMMNFLLQSDMHIICCYKCKEPMEEKIVDGKKVYVKMPMTIITEPDAQHKYDVTISMLMSLKTYLPTVSKCPEPLQYLFDGKSKISTETGKGIVKWLNTPQRSVDDLIADFKKCDDEKIWYSKLHPSEQFVVRKHKPRFVKEESVQKKETPVEPEVKQQSSDDLGDI